MKRTLRALWVLLILSFGFNLFFVSAYLRSRAVVNGLRSEEGRMRILSKKLNLTESQEKEIKRLRRRNREEIRKLKIADRADIDAFWSELMRTDPDSEKIEDLLAATARKREEKTVLQVRLLEKICALLDPEQRRTFLRMVREKDYLSGR